MPSRRPFTAAPRKCNATSSVSASSDYPKAERWTTTSAHAPTRCGSDLGSLRPRAVPDGEGWLVTGQKVWTSYALLAQWCVLAACTDPTARTSRRITLFIVPMDRDGIEVRPIASMLGPHHLNEVFLDNVRVSP